MRRRRRAEKEKRVKREDIEGHLWKRVVLGLRYDIAQLRYTSQTISKNSYVYSFLYLFNFDVLV